MRIDAESRRARFAPGELASFSPGPRRADAGAGGRWRLELGSHWHREKRSQMEAAVAAGESPAGAVCEVPVRGVLVRRGWTFELEGRVDQSLPAPGGGRLLRELKTTLARLPRPAAELRADHPEHFHQLGLYLALWASTEPERGLFGEVLYVEVATGLEQRVAFEEADRLALEAHLEGVADFLEQRHLALRRLRELRWSPAHAVPRPGQETIVADLSERLFPGVAGVSERARPVVLAAPTGFGKTGVLLEAAFAALRAGRVQRVVYLTGKSTGQLHVLATLRKMLGSGMAEGGGPALAAWHVRPKREHCLCAPGDCVRGRCVYLEDLPRRWREAGLARLHLFPTEARDLPALRSAGQAAGVCPFEITRAALSHCDVWLGDVNYLFAPANRGVFVEQPGWDPESTLLVVDEAHHLPGRVAESLSHGLSADELHGLLAELPDGGGRGLRRDLESLWRLVSALPAAAALDLDAEDDLAAGLRAVVGRLAAAPLDYDTLAGPALDLCRRLPALIAWLEDGKLEKLVWCPRAAELRFTCLDAAPVIGAELERFAGVVLASATPPPAGVFAAALGIDDGLAAPLVELAPLAPWREGAYDVAVDLRVDTSYRRRADHHGTTVATLARLRVASPGAPVVAFFPSYAYAEAVAARLENDHPGLRAAVQPRGLELAGQEDWIEESMALADVLVFVLGGSFAEGIDHLGGRITHALVAGPALPEVNAVQAAREACLVRSVGKAEAFRRVYAVPGLQKVNQALGRLVRAPGHRAKVVLHCRRFAEASYGALLAPEYQLGRHVLEEADLAAWLAD